MRKVRSAAMVALPCALLLVGCGSSAPTHQFGQAPQHRSDPACVAGKRIGNETTHVMPPTCPNTRGQVPAKGAEAIRHRALLCFTDDELRLDAGEALGSIEPGQRFPGRRRIIRENFHTAIGNVARSLRIVQRFADDQTRPTVDRITRLAHAGIHRIRHHPSLVVRGGIQAFRRADDVARRAGLRHCLS